MYRSRLALHLRLKALASPGFTLVEVLVGVMLTLTFVGVSTQAFVVSTMFKVRGQELSEATTWIQQDTENIRFEASRLNTAATAIQDQAAHETRCAAGNAESGYGDMLRDVLAGVDETGSTADNSPEMSALGERPYILRRVMTPADSAPYNIVQVRYAVYAAGEEPADPEDTMDAAAIATSYSEIIPNASFACE